MELKNRHGQVIEFDPFSQSSIDAAKSKAPGEGVGIAVSKELTNKIASGEITRLGQLPSEYQKLGQVCGLSA